MIWGVSVIGMMNGSGVSLAKNGICVIGAYGVSNSRGAQDVTKTNNRRIASFLFMGRVHILESKVTASILYRKAAVTFYITENNGGQFFLFQRRKILRGAKRIINSVADDAFD